MGKGQRERELEDPKQALRAEPRVGLETRNSEIMTRAEAECLTDRATQVLPVCIKSLIAFVPDSWHL